MSTNDRIAGKVFNVAPGIWGMKDVFVNFYMVQDSNDPENWMLIDAGLKWSASKIKQMADFLFGENSKPTAIVLTHGHFDHVGSLERLAYEWDVPVYAHYLEIPYLTGKSGYPPPDPTVGGGLMASFSWVYPSSPIDIWNRITVLPEDGIIPGFSEWKYIHTPGHSAGHVSLYRDSDKVLIAGDAFVTTLAESAFFTITQKKHISGPPKYFTPDWQSSENSLIDLASLQPKVAATGHGKPMRGIELRDSLLNLSQHFNKLAVPKFGRYVDEPAVSDATGVLYLPPSTFNGKALALKVVGITSLFVFALVWSSKKKKKRKEVLNGTLLDIEYNF